MFADIDPETWCLAPENIEAKITTQTRTIVPVHVFGNACDVEAIEAIAQQHNLKVIYDASHAFGVKYKGESLLKHGDAATLSFYTTKLFHTGEGGAIIFKRKEDLERAKKMINFGITGPECIEELGINAKMNEMQPAMRLCMLDEMETNLQARREILDNYAAELSSFVQLQKMSNDLLYNYSYFPIVFETEQGALKANRLLKENEILARRYFYPSLESVCFLGKARDKLFSDSISKRILCIPIYSLLSKDDQGLIISLLKSLFVKGNQDGIYT